MISDFYVTKIWVYRQVYFGNKSNEQAIGFVMGQLQQATDVQIIQFEGQGNTVTHRIWCAPDEEIEESDRLVIGSDHYSVEIIRERNRGDNAHKEVWIQKTERPVSA